jgi:hypothetical protein
MVGDLNKGGRLKVSSKRPPFVWRRSQVLTLVPRVKARLLRSAQPARRAGLFAGGFGSVYA